MPTSTCQAFGEAFGEAFGKSVRHDTVLLGGCFGDDPEDDEPARFQAGRRGDRARRATCVVLSGWMSAGHGAGSSRGGPNRTGSAIGTSSVAPRYRHRRCGTDLESLGDDRQAPRPMARIARSCRGRIARSARPFVEDTSGRDTRVHGIVSRQGRCTHPRLSSGRRAAAACRASQSRRSGFRLASPGAGSARYRFRHGVRPVPDRRIASAIDSSRRPKHAPGASAIARYRKQRSSVSGSATSGRLLAPGAGRVGLLETLRIQDRGVDREHRAAVRLARRVRRAAWTDSAAGRAPRSERLPPAGGSTGRRCPRGAHRRRSGLEARARRPDQRFGRETDTASVTTAAPGRIDRCW